MGKLVSLDLGNVVDGENRLWFDRETGDCYYGPAEDRLISAEAMELQSGYRRPKLYVEIVKQAFLIGLLCGLEESGSISTEDFEYRLQNKEFN